MKTMDWATIIKANHEPQTSDDHAPSWFRIHAEAKGEVEVGIYDYIGQGGFTSQQLLNALRPYAKRNLHIRVNSGGGDVFEGITIFNQLRQHHGTVRVTIDGLAASAASVIAMAGSQISMHPTSFMMIHNAWGMVVGDAHEMRAMADVLEKVSNQIAQVYASRTTQSVDQIQAWMADEAWMTAEESATRGFADVILGDSEPGAEAEAQAAVKPEIAPEAPHTIRTINERTLKRLELVARGASLVSPEA